MREEYVRAWTAEEILSFANDPMGMVKLSDELALKISGIMFGRHPGVQLLTIADIAARWVNGHEPGYRQRALNEIKQAISELAKLPNEP